MTQSDWIFALLLLGAVVVAGVWLLNGWQERAYRRRAQQAFRNQERPDALLGDNAPRMAPEPRRQEPLWTPPPQEEVDEDLDQTIPVLNETPASSNAGILDADIDYIIVLQPKKRLSAEDLRRAVEQGEYLPRVVLWEGLNELTGWEAIDFDRAAAYPSVRAGMQLANRQGAVTLEMLAKFCDAMQYFADRWNARIQFPDRKMALEQARKLDLFCAEVDVVIGLTLVSRDGVPLNMSRVARLAEEARLEPYPPHGWQYVDEGLPVFHFIHSEGHPIDLAHLRNMTCFSLSFTLDVPKAPGGIAAFDRVAAMARHFAKELQAELVDDHRTMLTEAALDTIRRQLNVIYSNMELRGLTPGSPLALRVFS